MFWYIWDTFGKIVIFRFLDVWSADMDARPPDTRRTSVRRTDDSDKTWTDIQKPPKRHQKTHKK